MKHAKRYITLTMMALLASATGCDKLLEEKPKTSISVGELDPTLLEQTIIGAYEPMTRSRGRLWESTVGLGFELMSEYMDGGASQSSWSNYNNVMNNPNSMQQPYTTLYEAIGRANGLINRLDANTTLDNSLKQKAYGEAYFIRAVCYYFAVRTWGRLPLRLKPVITPADAPLALSDPQAVYAQIITDLKFAETALPPTVTTANAGRATSGAAKVALADVYLTMGDWTNARAKAKEVMDAKATYGYDLEPQLGTVYSPTLATNREDVFSLKFSQVVDRGGFLASYYADSRAKAAGFSASGNKFGGVISVAPLIKNWNDNDLRKRFSLYTNYLINGVLTQAEIEPGIYDVRLGKYKDPNAPIDTGNGNDFYFWRYADVLLIFAEAENRLNGPTTEAYAAINTLRRRGYGVDMNTPSALADLPGGLTQSQFDDLVFRERGYEFIGECKRWFDLVRTGRAAKEIGDVRAAISVPTRKPVPNILLFRLPDVEFQTNPLAQ